MLKVPAFAYSCPKSKGTLARLLRSSRTNMVRTVCSSGVATNTKQSTIANKSMSLAIYIRKMLRTFGVSSNAVSMASTATATRNTETEAEYTERGFFHFLVDTDIHPHLCHSKMTKDENGENKTVFSYTVEVFEPTLPRHSVRRRLKNYVQFLDGEGWQSETDEDKLPVALFICPTKADMIYCKRATKRLLKDAWDAEKIHMRFTMIESVKKQGFRARIWEEVVPPVEDD